MPFVVSIITPERALPEFTGVEHVTVVAVDGQLGIRSQHAPIVALLKEPGYVMIRIAGEAAPRAFAVRGGVAQMVDNRLKVLTPSAVDVQSLDPAAARKQAEGEKDPAKKAWIEHQLSVAASFPAAVGRV